MKVMINVNKMNETSPLSFILRSRRVVRSWLYCASTVKLQPATRAEVAYSNLVGALEEPSDDGMLASALLRTSARARLARLVHGSRGAHMHPDA